MKKILSYSGFFGIGSLNIITFLTSKSYLQLGTAVAIYLFLVYYAYRLFIHKRRVVVIPLVQTKEINSAENIETEDIANKKKEDLTVVDFNKRAFLKLIGATGISFFLLSLINRKGVSIFGGNSSPGITAIEDNAGNKINPAQSQPTDSYLISEIDDGEVTYYGFTDHEGGWFIMREDVNEGNFRYSKGENNFQNNWEDRQRLKYDYYYNVFKIN